MYQVRSGYNDVALIEEYRRGLNKALEERCRMTYPKPATISDWMTRAVDIDKEYRIGRSKFNLKTSQPRAATSTPNTFTPRPCFEPRRDAPRPTIPTGFAAKRDPNAMDVDAARQDARSKGLCYTCKKPGHQFYECPEKKTYATRQVDIGRMTKEERAGLLEQLQDFAEGQE